VAAGSVGQTVATVVSLLPIDKKYLCKSIYLIDDFLLIFNIL